MQLSNIQLAVAAYREHGTKQAAADSLGWTRSKMRRHLHRAAERGLMGPAETLPGFAIRQVTSKLEDGTIVQQRKEAGPVYEPTDTLALKGKTSWVNAEGRVTQQDIMVRAEAAYDALGRGSDADAQVIARAILAERKRCADVARERVFDDHALAQATDIGRGCHLAASEIVEAIEVTQ